MTESDPQRNQTPTPPVDAPSSVEVGESLPASSPTQLSPVTPMASNLQENVSAKTTTRRKDLLWSWTHPPKLYLLLAAGVLVVAGIIAIVIAAANLGRIPTDSLRVAPIGPTRSIAGDVYQMEWSLTNITSVPVTTVEYTVDFPQAFVSDDGKKVAVGTFDVIAPGAMERIVIRGRMYGEPNDSVRFQFSSTYIPENFSSTFQQESSHTVQINPSPLVLNLSLPQQVFQDDGFEGVVTVENPSAVNFGRLLVQLSTPNGYTLQGSTPALTPEKEWPIENLSAGAMTTLKFNGTLATSGLSGRVFQVVISVVDPTPKRYEQQRTEQPVTVITPDIQLTEQVEQSTILANADARYQLTVKNTGTQVFQNIAVRVDIESTILDLSKTKIGQEGIILDSSLNWNNTIVPQFKSMKPGDAVTLTYTLSPLKPLSIAGDSFSIVTHPRVIVNNRTVDGQGNTVKLKTEVDHTITYSAFDAQNRPVGSGPTTPQVGKKTTYRVTITVASTINPLIEGMFTTSLPLGVSWEGNAVVSGGQQLGFNSQTGEVIWKIGNIGALSRSAGNTMTATFDISVVPGVNQANTTMTLVQDSRFTARDSWVQAELTSTEGALRSPTIQP